MIVKRYVLGELANNVYLVQKGNECLIVDPACNFEFIKNIIGDLKLVGILVTHYHFDHIGALNELKKHYNVSIFDNTNDLNTLDNFDFEIIHNPGHSSDSVSFYFKEEDCMFVGDFIFKRTIGRTDLETGNMKEMLKSLETIKKYSDDILIYPGHGDITKLGYEKLNNIYLK